ncbi:MAG: DMT family transporter [Candidatus Tectomicrobia bacterium]|uniref:DMT family transporter n=1 Tax=Tectimicrobiota bacterium TaxID=2528274 RepID=A0A932I183_UNCTE|nr:DMT family transporter [Candidatus Tectomicrobia bacterium]
MDPLIAVTFSVTSAVVFASFSVLVRKTLSVGSAYAGAVISLVVGLPILGGLSLLFSSWERLTWEAAAWFALGGLFAPGLGRLLLFQGIRHIGVGRTMPLVMLTPVFSTALAVAWLGERPGPAAWLATASVAAGCVLLSLKPVGDADWRRVHLLLPLGHAAVLALASITRRHALLIAPDPIIGSFLANLVSLPCVLACAPLFPPEERFRVNRTGLLRFGLISVLNTFAFLLFFSSFRFGEVWLVVPLGYSAPLFSLLFARFFLREEERVTWQKGWGALLLFLGMAIIVWQAA